MKRTEASRGIRYRALIPVLVIGSMAAAEGEPRRARGTVLPIQDRAGNPQLLALVRDVIQDELQLGMTLTPFGELRDELRRQRIRDADRTHPRVLRELATAFDVQWMLSATVHVAVQAEVPRVTVSGWAFQVDEPTLSWAGFRSRSGLESRRSFNRGAIGDLETLTRLTVKELVQDFRATVWGAEPARSGRGPADRSGFLEAPRTPEELGVVAVIPFQSVTDRDGLRNAEMITALARAALHRAGVQLAHPGLVSSVLRRRGIHTRPELDRESRAALGIATGAGYLLSGVVETWSAAGGFEPNPRVALSGRLVEIESGRIVWINGQERAGWSEGGLFATGRVYDPGALAVSMMDSLVGGFLVDDDRGKR